MYYRNIKKSSSLNSLPYQCIRVEAVRERKREGGGVREVGRERYEVREGGKISDVLQNILCVGAFTLVQSLGVCVIFFPYNIIVQIIIIDVR